jgi:hypothetical protein
MVSPGKPAIDCYFGQRPLRLDRQFPRRYRGAEACPAYAVVRGVVVRGVRGVRGV